MNVKELFEVKYAGEPPSWTSDIKGYSWTSDEIQFVKTNRKLLDEIYTVVKLSFLMFNDMSLDYMDDNPEEYTAEERDPETMALTWWQSYAEHDVMRFMEDEPEIEARVARLDQDYIRTISSKMAGFIINNAEHIVNEN